MHLGERDKMDQVECMELALNRKAKLTFHSPLFPILVESPLHAGQPDQKGRFPVAVCAKLGFDPWFLLAPEPLLVKAFALCSKARMDL